MVRAAVQYVRRKQEIRLWASALKCDPPDQADPHTHLPHIALAFKASPKVDASAGDGAFDCPTVHQCDSYRGSGVFHFQNVDRLYLANWNRLPIVEADFLGSSTGRPPHAVGADGQDASITLSNHRSCVGTVVGNGSWRRFWLRLPRSGLYWTRNNTFVCRGWPMPENPIQAGDSRQQRRNRSQDAGQSLPEFPETRLFLHAILPGQPEVRRVRTPLSAAKYTPDLRKQWTLKLFRAYCSAWLDGPEPGLPLML